MKINEGHPLTAQLDLRFFFYSIEGFYLGIKIGNSLETGNRLQLQTKKGICMMRLMVVNEPGALCVTGTQTLGTTAQKRNAA